MQRHYLAADQAEISAKEKLIERRKKIEGTMI
jgi:hypothetical protein